MMGDSVILTVDKWGRFFFLSKISPFNGLAQMPVKEGTINLRSVEESSLTDVQESPNYNSSQSLLLVWLTVNGLAQTFFGISSLYY